MLNNWKFSEARKLTQGGTSEIFTVRDDSGHRYVIKVLHSFLDIHKYREQFNRECLIHSRFSHPNIVKFVKSGRKQDRDYLITEYAGNNLQDFNQENKSPNLPAILHIGAEILNALDYLHNRQNVVHGDINPSNILLSPNGQIRLCDFGMAFYSGDNISLADGNLNNLAYLSPENANGEQLDKTSDLFAFFVVLWQLIEKRSLFKGKTKEETFKNVQKCNAGKISIPNCPEILNDFICRNLSKSKEKRLATVKETITELRSITKEIEKRKSY